MQEIFDRFGVSADFIAKNLEENFSAKNLKKLFSADFIAKNLEKKIQG